ncbi:MAG: iron-sulfur cluster assembly scaffold protein [Candidatus Wolfebacteria bacterium]|nr:iron-sulfur cluster assembly scaffold protein [Candidatus Wolfebacteria bacterium]
MTDKNEKLKYDVAGQDPYKSDSWIYSDVVKEHFFNPRNVLLDDSGYKADGTGMTGSPECGDVMQVWIKVNPETKKISDCKWRTFGCASAIASTSVMSVMVTENNGMSLEKALNLKPQQILERLGGLPDRKFHCSVLGHMALREAVLDYLKKNDNTGNRE